MSTLAPEIPAGLFAAREKVGGGVGKAKSHFPWKRNSEIQDFFYCNKEQVKVHQAAGIAVGAALTQHLTPITAA